MADVDRDPLPVRIAVNTLEDEFERPRGIFTQVDRQFLSGFKEYEYKQSESNRRQGIRERIVESFRDFRLLAWVAEKERSRIFDELAPGTLHDSFVSLLAFVYRGIDRDSEALEQMVQSAIFRVESEYHDRDGYEGGVADVSVDIDIDHGYDASEIYERFEQGQADKLTPAEIGVLVRAGKLGEEDISQLALESIDGGPDGASLEGKPWFRPDRNEDEE